MTFNLFVNGVGGLWKIIKSAVNKIIILRMPSGDIADTQNAHVLWHRKHSKRQRIKSNPCSYCTPCVVSLVIRCRALRWPRRATPPVPSFCGRRRRRRCLMIDAPPLSRPIICRCAADAILVWLNILLHFSCFREFARNGCISAK